MSDERIPLLIFGDGPRLPSGLARIARDLTVRLVGMEEELGIRVAQVGVDDPGGWQWGSWDFYGFLPTDYDQGRSAVQAAADQLQQETGRQPIVWMITDPARCYDLTREAASPEIDVTFWGYLPIDGQNRLGAVGGPAAECVRRTDRLLAYGRYGAGVLKQTLVTTQPKFRHLKPVAPEPISYLPHGIDTQVFRPYVDLALSDEAFFQWQDRQPDEAIHLGCVATNQPRKDLGLLFSTVAELKAAGHKVAVWLHTDFLTKVWDIGELVRTCGLSKQEVFVSLGAITDQQLAARYGWCDVTIAPGLGEGFGYPIVESLACGTPCIHGNYAGGVELIPDPKWLVEPVAWRLESVYALLRPVYSPKDFAVAVLYAFDQVRTDRSGTSAYCSGAVSYLDWSQLWPRWESWIRKGLAEHGQR